MGRSLHLWVSDVAQLLHPAHLGTKGEKEPFAAICKNDRSANKAAVRKLLLFSGLSAPLGCYC